MEITKNTVRLIIKGLIILCVVCIATIFLYFLHEAYVYNKGLKSEINRYYDTFLEWSFNGWVCEISEYGIKIKGISNNKDNIIVVGQDFIPPVSVITSDIQPNGESIINVRFMPDDSTKMFNVGDSVVKQHNSPQIKIGEYNIIVSEDSWMIE